MTQEVNNEYQGRSSCLDEQRRCAISCIWKHSQVCLCTTHVWKYEWTSWTRKYIQVGKIGKKSWGFHRGNRQRSGKNLQCENFQELIEQKTKTGQRHQSSQVVEKPRTFEKKLKCKSVFFSIWILSHCKSLMPLAKSKHCNRRENSRRRRTWKRIPFHDKYLMHWYVLQKVPEKPKAARIAEK